ncbi:hypothetical protein HHI36_007799 [Cryptolaemus montrouzieri]|uniref:Uncharacterized protein n=1 Tax=Cryptolaemus montrouzieri TaxID=559131 RepID=A0ABD2MQI4_9CUCU
MDSEDGWEGECLQGRDLCSGEVHRKSSFTCTMDYYISDDEDVNDLCKLLGIKIPPNKKNEKVTNKEKFDINYLPVVIVPDNANVSGEVSGHDLSESHMIMVEATVRLCYKQMSNQLIFIINKQL